MTKEDFIKAIVGKTIKKIHFDDNEKGSDNDYPICSLEFEDGTHLGLGGSDQICIDTVWASLIVE